MYGTLVTTDSGVSDNTGDVVAQHGLGDNTLGPFLKDTI